DFAVSRPFVPGADREAVDSLRREYHASAGADSSLPSIEAFLDKSVPPTSSRAAANMEVEFATGFATDEDELPPVEHFVDPLPSVNEYGARLTAEARDSESFGFSETTTSESATSDSGEWGESDWQQFDWRSAARLGETADTEATDAWAATDWDAS